MQLPPTRVEGISCSDLPKLSPQALEKQPAPVILFEGACSANLKLADLIALKELIDFRVLEHVRRLEKLVQEK